jgi:formylglycine-generating enzyme required for sulfatase activity
MVVVPPGNFMMGASKEDIDNGICAANEGPQHKVILTRPFAAGRFQVTRDQFEAFAKETGHKVGDSCYTTENNTSQERVGRSFRNPGYLQTGIHPAVCLNWGDAKAYVEWLSRTTRKDYRLLSEAEWEYIARAGSDDRHDFGNDSTYKAPVGSSKANAIGIFDVPGSVWEWMEDCFYNGYSAAPTDGSARLSGLCAARTVRGLRASTRMNASANARYDDIGFRVAKTLKP